MINGNPSTASHTYVDGTDIFTILATATDEDGTWDANATGSNAFVSVDQPGATDMNYDLVPLGLPPATSELYLRYELTCGNMASPCLFISDDRFAKDTFVVQGTITHPPISNTMMLLQ